MSFTPSASRLSLVVAGMLCAALAACSSAPADDQAVNGGEDALVSDAASMTQRPDGTWDVVCKDGRHEVVTVAEIVADKVCNGAAPSTCVQKCEARFDNGTCKTYAPDFCGPAASCVKQCNARFDNGTCKTYSPDYCGPASTCITSCAARFDNGTCKTYGADFCGAGTNLACVKQCSARFDNGTCKTYGADFCKAALPAPTCTSVCVARFDNGTCKTYGPDLCQ